MLALKAENISKQYRLGQVGTGTLTHDLNRFWHKVRGKENPYLKIGEANDRTSKGSSDYVWSLQDINFEIEQGDAVGIIGRNGAGKSTLLKILSKVTQPTTGKIYTNGRIASLLEVGTGFHPEMTGRENVYLNGAILGMTKKEITRKFDEIVDFSGVERYIDTPVKRYSSGMYVRLAFAVAAHLESEIMIVDEVLAVGDYDFQKKCLGKMDDVSSGQGRTVLFVSHNMGMISQLCNKSILLEKGRLLETGKTEKIIGSYLDLNSSQKSIVEKSESEEENFFKEVKMCDSQNCPTDIYEYNDKIYSYVQMNISSDKKNLELAMRLIDKHKNAVFTIHEPLSNFEVDEHNNIKVSIQIPDNFLTPGKYSWTICINHPGNKLYDLNEDVVPFTIMDTGSDFARYDGQSYGNVYAKYNIRQINTL